MKILIFIFLIACSGCSLIRNTGSTVIVEPVNSASEIEDPERYNLYANNYDINKAEIEVYNNEESQKLLAFMKYRTPGNFLVSIRSRAGIEAARIYITRDTVLINDRINKKLFMGSPEFLAAKYGITGNALPLITGDVILDIFQGPVKCKNGTGMITGSIDMKKAEYNIDCRIDKAISTKIYNHAGNQGLIFNYKKFRKQGDKIFPSEIEVEDFQKTTRITILIGKIDFDDNEPIDFVAGNNYEKVLLK